MSEREWKSGDVVVLDLRSNGPSFLAANLKAAAERHERRGYYSTAADIRDLVAQIEGEATTARPLVVIDPEDREQVERLAKAMHESDHIAPWHDLHNETRAQIEDAMQAALREFAAPTPAKPDEPLTGGSQVREADGTIWTRVEGQPNRPWVYSGSDATYAALDVVEVLR